MDEYSNTLFSVFIKWGLKFPTLWSTWRKEILISPVGWVSRKIHDIKVKAVTVDLQNGYNDKFT